MIKLRAHHLLCLSKFNEKSQGYNKCFGGNFSDIFKIIIGNQKIKIKIIRECDDICKKCPYIKNRICNKPSKYKIPYWIKVQDNKTMRLIGIKSDSVHKADDIFKMVMNKVNEKNLKKICKGCEYLNRHVRDSFNKSLIQRIS